MKKCRVPDLTKGFEISYFGRLFGVEVLGLPRLKVLDKVEVSGRAAASIDGFQLG